MPRKRSRAKLWLLIHGWLALPIWAFLLLICITGTIATVSHELTWLFDAGVRATVPSADATRLGPSALAAAIERQMPGSRLLEIAWPVEQHFALTVELADAQGIENTVYVNPYTGQVQGIASTVDFSYFARALHGWLFLPFTYGYSWGWYIVSAMSIPLLGSLVSGIIVHKKFWRLYFAPKLRINKGGRIFWGDFHRLAGIWLIPFVAIIGISALWFLIEAMLYDLGYSLPGEIEPPPIAGADLPVAQTADDVPHVSLDLAMEAARAARPRLNPAYMELPAEAYAHIEVMGRGAWPLVFETVAVNPYSGQVDSLQTAGDLGVVGLVTQSMRPLHTGDFLGVWLKVLYFLCGVLMTLMVLSGALIWLKRTARATSEYLVESRRPIEEPAE